MEELDIKQLKSIEELEHIVEQFGAKFPERWCEFSDDNKRAVIKAFLNGGLTLLGFYSSPPDYLEQIAAISAESRKILEEMFIINRIWAMLPEGLEVFFEIEGFEKNDTLFRIVLVETDRIFELPEAYSGKTVVNTVMRDYLTLYFPPIRGMRGELILRRRLREFEGMPQMLEQNIDVCFDFTQFGKEFAAFLEELASSCGILST